jgi:hypothetical protein
MKNIHLIATDKPSRLHLGKSGLVLCDLVFNPTTINSQNIYITNSEKPKARDWVLGDFPDNPIGKVISKYGQEFTAQSLNGDKYGLAEYDSNKIILTDDKDLIKDGVQSIDDEFLQWFVKNNSCEYVEIIKNYLSNNGQWKDVLLPSEWEIDTKIKYKIIIPHEEPKNTCPKCRTKDFDTCHSIKCPMRKEEPKHIEDEFETQSRIINKVWDEEEPKQETLEEVNTSSLENLLENNYDFNVQFHQLKRESIFSFAVAIYGESLSFKEWQEKHYGKYIEISKWQAEQDKNKYNEEDIAIAFNEGQAYSVTGKLVDGKEWVKTHKKEWFENFKNK